MSRQQLRQLINVQLTGNQQIAAAITQMNQNFDRLGRQVTRTGQTIARSMGRATRATQRNAQQTRSGLTNIQSGLVQLSTFLLNINVKINNVFSNMKTRFTEAETAMTQLKITMGLSGQTANNAGEDFRQFAEASGQIDLLARTTQFTKREVADAFTALVQSGRTVDEAMKMISSTLQFATASGGMLNLTDSVDLATLTIGTLGGSVGEVDGNLNMLLKTSQKTKIGFRDLRQVLQSMRSAFTNFGETVGVSREAELMATAAALRTLGLSAGNSGQVVDQFSRSMNTMYSTLNKVFMMDKQVGRKGSKRPRFSYKREALAELFGVSRFSVADLQRELNSTETDLRKLQDRFLMGQLFEYDKTGTRGAQRSLSDFISRLVKGYARLRREMGEGPASSIIKSAIGTAGATTLIKSIVSLAKTSGKSIDQAADHYMELVKELQTNNKEMLKADEEAKMTIAYRTKVLDSAIAALSNTIFEQDVVAISALDTYKEMVSATNTLMTNNKGLASSVGMLGRGFQILTSVGTNVGFVLVAAATFSHALTVATAATGGAVTGLSATLGAFARMFLLPTLTVVGQFTLALGGLGIAVVALINYFSDGMGVAKGFKVMLDDIKFAAMSAGGMINLAFSKDYGGFNTKRLIKDYYKVSDAMAAMERERAILLAAGPSNTKQIEELDKRYNALGAKMSKMKGVLGESGYVGLDALGARGAGGLAVTFAGLIQLAKDLIAVFKTVTEGALVPLTLAMDGVVFVASTIGSTVLLPFRALAHILGFASDEASLTHIALKGLGYILGVLLGYRLLASMFSMLSRTLAGMRAGFTSVGAAVTGYTNRVQSNLQENNRLMNTFQRQASSIGRLEMTYAALTGSIQATSRAQQQFARGTTLTGQAIDRQRTRLQGWATATRSYMASAMGFMAGMAGVVGMVGGLMTQSSDEATASMGNTLMTLGMVSSAVFMLANALIPMLGSAFQFLTASAGLALGALTSIAIITGGLFALFGLGYYLTKYLSSPKEPKSPFEKMNMSASVVPKTNAGTASLTPRAVTPNTASATSTGGGTAFGSPNTMVTSAPARQTINYPDQTVVNIDRVELRAQGTPEGIRSSLLSTADNKPKTSGAVSFAK